MPRALLSVSDKSDLIDFARGLASRGFTIISTGGTASTLAAAGVTVVSVSDVTQFPEMLDGRIKTLHPAIHAGILARRDLTSHLDALRQHHLEPIDIVVVNLYPFSQTAARPDASFDELIEQIDIGGPAMVRSAAKNFADVLIVVDPADYTEVLSALDTHGGPSKAFRFALAQKAFAHTAGYDETIASTLAAVQPDDSGFRRVFGAGRAGAPDRLRLSLPKVRDLRYGENPHQNAAWYSLAPIGLGAATVLQGKELSFTNLLDLDAAARIVMEFDEPAAAVIKHTNPCGVAVGSGAADAYVRARDADALSAFGGVVGLNRALDVAAATALTSTFIEAVIAPDVLPDAREALAAKPNMRVIEARLSAAEDAMDLRSILGGVLAQQPDRVPEARVAWPGGDSGPRVVTKRSPTGEEWEALRFAWRVCAHVKSNAVLFAAAGRTLAIGAGQMSRVDAVKVAMMKAGESLRDSVAASDAFFPFRDGLDAIADAGATAVVQPGGSVRDAEVIGAANERGLAMVFTGWRHFRH